MKELTLAAGVPVKYFEHFGVFDGQATLPELQKFLDYLEGLRHKEYFAVLEIWRLISPQTWQNYTNMGFNNLREQLLLRDRQKVLRNRWRQYYKENSRGEEEPTEQEVDSRTTS